MSLWVDASEYCTPLMWVNHSPAGGTITWSTSSFTSACRRAAPRSRRRPSRPTSSPRLCQRISSSRLHVGASPSIPEIQLLSYLGPWSLRLAQQVRHVSSPQEVSQHKQERQHKQKGRDGSGAKEGSAAGALGMRCFRRGAISIHTTILGIMHPYI